MDGQYEKKKTVYIAGPLFSEAELKYNMTIRSQLTPFFNVFLPQEDGSLLSELIINGMSLEKAQKEIFNNDIRGIQTCDILLILLHGRTIDEGAALELGYAYALDKYCIGLQTDIRRLFPYGNNPMVDCALHEIFQSEEEMLAWANNHSSCDIGIEIQVQNDIASNVDFTHISYIQPLEDFD